MSTLGKKIAKRETRGRPDWQVGAFNDTNRLGYENLVLQNQSNDDVLFRQFVQVPISNGQNTAGGQRKHEPNTQRKRGASEGSVPCSDRLIAQITRCTTRDY